MKRSIDVPNASTILRVGLKPFDSKVSIEVLQ